MSLLDKYLASGEDWLKLCSRVSGIMQYAHERLEVFDVLSDKKFIPNSPCLINAGRPGGRNLMACNVLHVGNSIKEIFDTATSCALLFKSGAGVGLELSGLSPANTSLKYAPRGRASGPVSFMRLFQTTADVVMEGGLRRAAIMGCLNANHPDILEFISCKEDDGIFNHFNISVTLDSGPDSLPSNIWDEIVERAYRNGEPGIIFLDNINRHNPTLEDFGPIIGANACAETPLYDNASCVLGSIVLPNVIEKAGDYKQLEKVTKLAVRFLNRVIDVNHYPLPEIAQSTRRTRDIGVGVMGWSTLLDKLGIPFVSDEALELAKFVACTIWNTADTESWELASRDGGYLPDRRRNRTLMAIAPTGHIARIAGVSHSIYPDYAVGLKMIANQHLDLIGTWQDYVDSGISYTVSFTDDKPVSFVDEVFRGAHERGIKAISVYQDGSREGQPCKVEGTCQL